MEYSVTSSGERNLSKMKLSIVKSPAENKIIIKYFRPKEETN